MIAAVRSARTVMAMTTREAEAFGIEEKRRNWFVRIDSAKSNFQPPQEKANWCERISIDLDNGDLTPGDSIGGLLRWKPPDPFEGLTNQAIRDTLTAINAGPIEGARYSAKANYNTWVGHCIAKSLELKSSSDAKQIAEAWFDSGLLYEDDYYNAKQRKDRKGVFVDTDKAPGPK